MKKIVASIVALILAANFVFAGGRRDDNAANGKHRIAVLSSAVTHGWVAGVAYYAEERCRELTDKITYRIYTSNNGDEMATQVDDAILWGADAIVVSPLWTGMEVPIKRAVDSGVIVVNFDTEINVDGIYLVRGDNEGMGIQGARYIVDKIGQTGNVVILEVPTSGSVSARRTKGFLDTIAQIAPAMQLQTYATLFTREAGLKDMADILTANRHIDAVFSIDDETSMGAIQAIKEAGRTDIKAITGGGGSQEYFNMMPNDTSIWIASALYSPLMMRDAIDYAVDLCDGKPVERVKIIPTTIVDRTNYRDFLDPNSPY